MKLSERNQYALGEEKAVLIGTAMFAYRKKWFLYTNIFMYIYIRRFDTHINKQM